jgi:6-phosphogluconate dehydrogenase
MGLGLTQNMMRNGIRVIGYDKASTIEMEGEFKQVGSLSEVVAALSGKRIIWLMVPAGEVTRQVVSELGELLSEGDIIIDGGNSFFKDSVENYEYLAMKGISFLDCGSSGGMSGALNGGNFMIGGNKETFDFVEKLFEKISCQNGYLYTGKSGSGHYLKMIHNGIEYAMMAAIGEGFDLLEHSEYDFDNEKVARLWNNGSVIRSWLIELAEEAFKKDPKLDKVKGIMYSSGEGKWTVDEALQKQVAIPVITMSLMMRYRSLEDDTFTGKVVSSLRNGFGGHAMKTIE